MKRKLIVGDQVIGGAPPQPPEEATVIPREHPHAVGSAPTFVFETSAAPFPTVQSAQMWACPGCHADLGHPNQLALHLALAHQVVRTNTSIESVAGLPLEETSEVRDNNGTVIGSVIIFRTRLYTEQSLRVETLRFVKPTFGPFAALTVTTDLIPMSALLDQMGNAMGASGHTGSLMFCEHANESPATCPCPPDCHCRVDTGGPCRTALSNPPRRMTYRALPGEPQAEEVHPPRHASNWVRRLASRVLFVGIDLNAAETAERAQRANRPDHGYCQCGHTMRQHETDRTGGTPEPCRICICAQYQRGT